MKAKPHFRYAPGPANGSTLHRASRSFGDPLARTAFGVLLLSLVTAGADTLNQWHWRAPLPQGNSLLGIVAANGQFVTVGDNGTVLTSSNGWDWTLRNSGSSTLLRAVTHAGDLFVTVGFGPTILTSPDGAVWSPRTPAVTTNLLAVTHGAGMFVAVGFAGAVVVSPDGVNWSARSASIPGAHWGPD